MLHDIGAFDVCAAPSCGGYGMIARRDLFQGTVVLRERPIAILRASTLQEAAAQVRPELVCADQSSSPFAHKIDAPSDVIARFAQLEFSKCSDDEQRRWLTLADAFDLPPTAAGIARTNSITDLATGDCFLFETLSRANHSCDPNMRFTLPAFAHDGNAVTVSMMRDVAKGSALTISYLGSDDLAKPTEVRRSLLKLKFNFVCECERCRCMSLNDEATTNKVRGDSPSREPPALGNIVTGRAAALPSSAPRASARGTAHMTPRSPSCIASLQALEKAQAALNLQLRACTELLGRAAPLDLPPVTPLLESVRACADALHATEVARQAYHHSYHHAPR